MKKNWLGIFTALLAFVGALIGAHISGEKNADLWEKQSRTEQIRAIVNKRVELIERTSKIINSQEKYKMYQSLLKMGSDVANDLSTLIREYPENFSEYKEFFEMTKINDFMQMVDLKRNREDLTIEYASIMQLNAIYFGPKTEEILKEITKKMWWDIKGDKFRELLKAMTDEMYSYPPLSQF